jgi:sphingolipid delta-4 desaturase
LALTLDLSAPDSAAAAAPSPARRADPISPAARRHMLIRREILKAHPEARALEGPDARSLPAALLVLALHWTLAALVAGTNLVVVFLAAFFLGQLLLHAAGSLVHETAHRLVFATRSSKLGFDLLLEVILGSFGRQLTYQHEHISSHHPHVGNYERDYEHEDTCRFLARRAHRARHPRRQRLVTAAELLLNLLPFGFLIADRIFAFYYGRATGRRVRDGQRPLRATSPTASERLLFIAVSALSNAFLFFVFGPLAWLYHVWSLSLFLGKFGISNLGQSLAEHPGNDDDTPTRSTYGALNLILFNTGYHNEHHTFPTVAWTRLPKLKALAPASFAAVNEHSYLSLWWRHVRDDFGPTRRNPMQQATDLARCSPSA